MNDDRVGIYDNQTLFVNFGLLLSKLDQVVIVLTTAMINTASDFQTAHPWLELILQNRSLMLDVELVFYPCLLQKLGRKWLLGWI